MQIPVNRNHMAILECFSSESRVHIIELLNAAPMNIKELAAALQLSSAIITKHVQKLEAAGIIVTHNEAGARGRQKICSLLPESITLQLRTPMERERTEGDRYAVSIPIGQYESWQVKPTCGLTSETQMIGIVDDPRYFNDPDHVKAKHLWFGSGYVEYRIPNYLVGSQRMSELNLSFEICSEAPGFNENWPSDITFHLNDQLLGSWTCPGDFGSTPGVFTPQWWNLGTQHGLLKTVSVRTDGTYLDGMRISDVNSSSLAIGVAADIRFRLSCLETARYCGGISLFGKQFGNYDQELEVLLYYKTD